MSKLPTYLILVAGIGLWFISTGLASTYSYRNYQEHWRNSALEAAEDMEDFFSVYDDMMASFYEVATRGSSVDKKLLLSAFQNFRNWRLAHYESGNVSFMGWYSFKDPKQESFGVNTSEKNPINLEFRDDIKNNEETTDSLFDIKPTVPFLKLNNYNKEENLILFKKFEEAPYGYLFIIVNKISFEESLKNSLAKNETKVSFNVNWDASHPDGFEKKENAYTKHIPFGDKEVDLTFYQKHPWNFFSRNNVSGLITSAFGFIIFILLQMYVHALAQTSMTSKQEKDTAERKLNELENFYEGIVENLPGILFIKDVKNGYQYHMFNKEAEYFFGIPRGEITGKTDFDYFNNEEASFFRAMDESVMAGGKVIDIPCEVVTTAIGERFVHTRKVPIYDADNTPKYLVGLSEDITVRKKNELELADYRKNLEGMVDERTARLKGAMAKAEEASRLKSEFLATMSHEIRSPMSGVLGMAELLLDTPLTSEQKNLTKTILNSGEVLMNIIEDILDFSKIEANKLELDPIAVNMYELVDDVCMLYSTRAREKALELVVYYKPGSEQFVYADPVRVRQVLGNLINNAIKFTSKGYIIVSVDEIKDENIPSDKVKLQFSVEDTGIGIEDGEYDKIFEKFSQANSSTTRNYGGTGLGLSICRKLVEMMGGQISVTSQPGHGSKFEFFLPMTRNREETFTQPKPAILKDRRILIVDDLPVIRHMLREQLSLAGMICDVADSGHEALIHLTKARDNDKLYDMIIIDYLMPGMNGEMLARAINDEQDFRNICLIMLTAAGNPLIGDDYAEKGFSAYISKPVKAYNLIESIAIIWQKYSEGYTDTLIRIDSGSINIVKNEEDHMLLEGKSILLVEDSRLNQAFAEEVLSQLMCDVVTVSNGQEALDEIVTRKFDLVLMDCQMPVMDGFEASRRISDMKEQGILEKDLPILALTANAMKGDRQKCLDSGMDDYITKPVRKKELKDKIFFWINKQPHDVIHIEDESLGTAEKVKTTNGIVSLLERDAYEEAKALLKDKFDFLLGCYIDDVESYIREIQDALANADMEAVIRPAHTIKSTSKRMGAMQLAELAKDIESAAREATEQQNGEFQASEDLLESIRKMPDLFDRTRNVLINPDAAKSANG
ncbi:MAG: hypothetical protein DI551_04675 [Micavibrio aeruginosavorus]|uniref:Sensory/regulatory protein RpfC n=1 Tax=Micavibrio aeruginosavorus TaxID=349221 RepID=A0A2W5N2N7_9BACT|nr:MAG: hypothetical protein DI551_04675 [Micavibrio aeruginosavorus]